jgi:hypothetical protein
MEEWQAALKNARAQLEYQRLRAANGALMQQYGSNAWRVYNYRLEVVGKSLDKELEAMNERITDVNRTRKNEQVSPHTHLHFCCPCADSCVPDGNWKATHSTGAKMDRAHLKRPPNRDCQRNIGSGNRWAWTTRVRARAASCAIGADYLIISGKLCIFTSGRQLYDYFFCSAGFSAGGGGTLRCSGRVGGFPSPTISQGDVDSKFRNA